LLDSQLGQLKLTTSKFYRVSGETTQHRGVIPDITYPSTFTREDFGESSYDNALAWDTIKKARYFPVDLVADYVPLLNEKHLQRRANSKEFGYLAEDIQVYQEKKDIKSMSLNMAARKAETEERKAKRLRRINQRLKDKGLEPIKSIKDYDESVFEDDDFRLQETGNILADYINLHNAKKLAEVKN
jgi:carboxyl-terminal processing protease